MTPTTTTTMTSTGRATDSAAQVGTDRARLRGQRVDAPLTAPALPVPPGELVDLPSRGGVAVNRYIRPLDALETTSSRDLGL